ncbi:MAG: PHP domain-containing protein [Patescibacteria group bacterium]
MLKIDLHTHSLMSGHGLNTVFEMAAEAKRRGIRILGIADHGPSMEGAPHEGYFWISDKLENLKGIKILLGAEVNIINKSGKIDLSDNYLSKQRIVIAGIHDKTPYKGSSEDHTTALVNAMSNKYVKIISHPFRMKFKSNIKKIVNAACSTNTLLELNDQLFEKESINSRFLEAYRMLVDLCKKSGLPIIIGSDAHVANRIGENKNILKVKKLIGLTDNMIINNREKELELFLGSNKGTYHF